MRVNILRSFADDYEDLAMVINVVKYFARDEDLIVEEAAIIARLTELIKEGYAKAYSFERLPQNQATVIEFQPDAPSSDETVYFYVTQAGKELAIAARNK